MSWAAVSVTPSSMRERRQPVSGFMRIRMRFRNNTDLNRIRTIGLRKKCSKCAHIPYILACHLQIDADPVPDPAYHFDADAEPDFYLMRIHTDPDPQHCDSNRIQAIGPRTGKAYMYPAVKGRVNWAAVSVTLSSMRERRQPVSGFMRIRMRFRNNTDLNRIRTIGPRKGVHTRR